MAPIALALLLAPLSGAPANGAPPSLEFRLQDPAPAAPAAPTEPEWTGSLTAGGLITTGNSETRTGNATADAELRREKDRFTLGFLWNYADEKNSTNDWLLTDRRTSGKGKYDYFLSEKSYLLAQVSAEADEAAALDLRTTAGVGAGRQFIEDETLKFAGEVGLSYFIEEYTTSDDEFLTARVAENVDWTLSERWNLLNTTEVFPSVEDSEDVYAKVDTRAKITLSESMFGQFQWVVDWDNTPAAGKKETDQRFLVSVGWKF